MMKAMQAQGVEWDEDYRWAAAAALKDILEALKSLVDPDRGGEVVSLGTVSGLVVEDGNVGSI